MRNLEIVALPFKRLSQGFNDGWETCEKVYEATGRESISGKQQVPVTREQWDGFLLGFNRDLLSPYKVGYKAAGLGFFFTHGEIARDVGRKP